MRDRTIRITKALTARAALTGLAALTSLAACAGDPAATGVRSGTAMPGPIEGDGTIMIPTVSCPPENPFCSAPQGMAPTRTPVSSCDDVSIDLAPAGINVMVAVDGSPSMMTHWPAIQTAVRSLKASNPGAQFGLHVFWGEVADVFWTMETTNTTNNICGAVHNDVLELGNRSEQELMSFMGAAPPGKWFLDGQIEVSPVIEPLNYYLTNASALADPTRTNYLVLISDGNDNCFGSFFSRQNDKLLAYQKLATELLKKNIRIIPIGFNAPAAAPMPGFFGIPVSGAVRPDTDLEVLGTLLEHGGAVLPEVPKVDDPSKLASVIQQVGQRISNCRFQLPSSLDPTASVNPFQLDFSINGVALTRDRKNQNGWNFVDGGTSQVELFGDGCVAIQSGQQVKASKSCAKDVCGTASVKVETKPRAVLLLLDSSASRIECVDGSLDCLSDPNSTPDRPLTFWETVQHATGEVLTAPINDDVEFGMQFFPRKTAEALSCDVATGPEITPAQGTEIGIMKAMLEKLPFGFSPLVQVMENVAATPGRLADPAALGAVVLLSDGGDNCSSEDRPQVLSRINAAAKQLLDMGVKTYAVRFGSEEGRTPEAEEELSALVTSGGTAIVDPANPSATPYVDADTAEELGAALADIADRLATCSFALEGLPEGDAAKDKANLYLNGEVIPFDQMGTKQNGWSWVDTERKTVELYGESCTAFKTNRRTSIVVEIGCPPVTVI